MQRSVPSKTMNYQKVSTDDLDFDKLPQRRIRVDKFEDAQTFEDFYPLYLGEHRNRINRRLHFIGSTFALMMLSILLVTFDPKYLLFGLLLGYGFAWVGHFFFEKNRPASFKKPLYSFMGDWMMYKDILTGQIPF